MNQRHFGTKRDRHRHSTTSFKCRSGRNKLSNVRSFIILPSGEGLTSLSVKNRTNFFSEKSKMNLSGVSFFKIRIKTLSLISYRTRFRPQI